MEILHTNIIKIIVNHRHIDSFKKLVEPSGVQVNCNDWIVGCFHYNISKEDFHLLEVAYNNFRKINSNTYSYDPRSN